MNLVIQKSGDKQYVSFRESYWDPVKRKYSSRTIKNFGRLDLLLKDDPDILDKLRAQAAALKENRKQKKLDDLRERVRQTLSPRTNAKAALDTCDARQVMIGACVYRQIWNKLDISRKLRQLQDKRAPSYDLTACAFFMTAGRSLMPDSKLSQWRQRNKFLYGGDTLKLHHLYRAIDVLADEKDGIVRYLNRQIAKVYQRDVSVALYDVTTFWFESQNADTLRNFGFSKDNKINQVQVVMGLLIDQNGVPFDYELFPGNTSEFGTMVPLLKKLQKEHGLKRVIVTADRGLNSGANLHAIRELGMDFVIANRVRGMGKKFKDLLVEDDKWTYRSSPVRADVSKYRVVDDLRKVQVFDEKTGKNQWVCIPTKLLINYSEHRARKDMYDRQRLVDKAMRYVDNPALIRSDLRRGGKSFLSIADGAVKAEIDEGRIREAAMHDGYYGICYSDANMTADEVLSIHHSLWQIEESFRISKSILKTRPCFHWTEKRIRGHFVICFLALVLHRLLEAELAANGINIASPMLVEALAGAVLTEIRMDDGTKVYAKSGTEGVYEQVAKVFELGTLPHLAKEQEVKKALKIRSL